MHPRLLRAPLALGLILAALIVIGALAFNLYRKYQRDQAAEHLTPLHLQPLTGPLLERTKFALVSNFGADALSTTIPVSATYQPVPFAQSFEVGHPDASSEIAQQGDVDDHNKLVPVTGAYIVRYSNSQLCDAEGYCPMVLMARSDDDKMIHSVLFQITARQMVLSSIRHNGNPDILVWLKNYDQPVRFTWSLQGQYPSYTPLFAQ